MGVHNTCIADQPHTRASRLDILQPLSGAFPGTAPESTLGRSGLVDR